MLKIIKPSERKRIKVISKTFVIKCGCIVTKIKDGEIEVHYEY